MKPIQLTMTAFGPYKNTEVIRFDELKGHRLFVVSGPTGAGKTTIFDGICFALYGQASGEDRTEIRAMRSDFADDSVQTSVELLFELHGRKFRIMRQIPYTKAGNKTETLARCELFELTDNGEVPAVDRQIVTEINKKIETLVGFTQSQFSQIVMLPQGEFRKFLTSDTENKETIMRKIFKTEPYQQIVERLKTKKDEAQQRLIKANHAIEGFIQQIHTAVPERDSTIFSVLANEHYNSRQVMEGLKEEILFYDKKSSSDKERYEETYKQHEALFAKLHTAKMINEQFDQLHNREKVLQDMTNQLPEVKKSEMRFEEAERASYIQEIEQQSIRAAEESDLKLKEYAVAKKEEEQAAISLSSYEKRYQEEEGKSAERNELSEQLLRLRDHLPAVRSLEEKKKLLLQIKAKGKSIATEVELTEKMVGEEKNKQSRLEELIDRLENDLLSFDEIVEKSNIVREQCKTMDAIHLLSQKAEHLKAAADEKNTHYEAIKKESDQLHSAWMEDVAARIAETLHDGDACPVCGSEHHPMKAHEISERAVSQQQLEEMKQRLVTAEHNLREASVALESCQSQLLEKKNEAQALDIRADRESLHLQRESLEKEIAALREKREMLSNKRKERKRIQDTLDGLVEKLDKLQKMLNEERTYYKTEYALFNQSMDSIPEEMRNLMALEEKILQVEKRKVELENAWTAIQKDCEKARERFSVAQSTLSFTKKAFEESVEKKRIAEERFLAALDEHNFPTTADYHRAKLPFEERQNLKELVRNHYQQMHTVSESIKELQKQLDGKEKIDLTELSLTVTHMKERYEAALSEWKRSIDCTNALSSLLEKIEQAAKDIGDQERIVGKIADLFDVVRGQNRMKLSFERFIQIDYLERIIQSANERLKHLSNGQYEFVRSGRQEMRGRQSGLSIDVYDAYTGQNRDVKTLSGGEKFNASLCLALGMADVIQSFQGSVSIDTMFIDEGFGTLDEESLRKAIDALIELQKTGRLIGIISHVEELKASLPAILQVEKSREGHSTTRFIIK